MANTYTQIQIHTIFVVKKRKDLIKKEWRDELYKYITGIIQLYNHKLLAINGMPDHLHVFFGMRPIQSLSDLMQEIHHWKIKILDEYCEFLKKFEVKYDEKYIFKVLE